jgi:hypothetical protein
MKHFEEPAYCQKGKVLILSNSELSTRHHHDVTLALRVAWSVIGHFIP